MNELQVFKHESFGNVRVIERGGEPWFVAADVCKALEIGNPSMALERLDSDEKMTLSSTESHADRGNTMRMSKAEFIARAVADMAAEKERKRRAIWRGRWEAAIAKGEHIEQMRRRKR